MKEKENLEKMGNEKMSRGLFFSLLASVLIFVLAVGYRTIINKSFTIMNYEIFLALLPLFLYGLFSGQIRRFEFFGLKVEKNFRDAVKTKITDIDILPIVPIEAEKNVPKDEETGLLPERILRKHPNALKFILGTGHDIDLPICDYLDALSTSPTFKYVIFMTTSNDFTAFVPVSSIARKLTPNGSCKARDLIIWIMDSNFDEISKIPGFIWERQSISLPCEKIQCLKEMLHKKIDVIPIVEKGKLLGVIEKSQLAQSLIIDVAAKL